MLHKDKNNLKTDKTETTCKHSKNNNENVIGDELMTSYDGTTITDPVCLENNEG